MLLEGSLHLDVPLGGDRVRRDEDALPLLGHFGVFDRAGLGDALHQLVRVPALGLGDGDEIFVHVGHHHAGLVAHERNGKKRLESRRAARDDRDGSRRSNRGDVAIAQQLHGTNALAVLVARARLVRAPDALGPLGERSAVAGETLRFLLAFDVDELHHLAAELHTLGRVVRDAEPDARVGEAHDAEPDAADALGERVDRLERVPVDVDDVVEEVRGEMDVRLEGVPIQLSVLHIEADVDRAEVADVVGEERLLAAGIRRFVSAETRHGVISIGFVDEEDAGLAGAPRAEDHAIPDGARVELARRLCRSTDRSGRSSCRL